jgi:hypothetical protein
MSEKDRVNAMSYPVAMPVGSISNDTAMLGYPPTLTTQSAITGTYEIVQATLPWYNALVPMPWYCCIIANTV